MICLSCVGVPRCAVVHSVQSELVERKKKKLYELIVPFVRELQETQLCSKAKIITVYLMQEFSLYCSK